MARRTHTRPSPRELEVLRVIRGKYFGVNSSEVVDKTTLTRDSTVIYMSRLLKKGLIKVKRIQGGFPGPPRKFYIATPEGVKACLLAMGVTYDSADYSGMGEEDGDEAKTGS